MRRWQENLMRNSRIGYFSFFTLSCVALCFESPSEAQTIKVKKLKGNQAIVEFVGNLENGQTYQIASDEKNLGLSMDDVNTNTSKISVRKNFIGFGFDFYNYSTDPGGVTTGSTVASTFSYGWNKTQYEFGPLLYFAMSGSAVTTTSFGVGGFYDYNFTKNKSGTQSIFAAGISGMYKSTSGGSTSLSSISLDPGVSWKYFAFIQSCLRFDVTYHYESKSAGSTNSNQSGPHISGSIVTYF